MFNVNLQNACKPLILYMFVSLVAVGSNPATTATASGTLFTFGSYVTGSRFEGYEQAPVASTTLWSLDLQYPFSLKRIWSRRMALGISLSGPYGTLRSLRAYQATDHYPLRYGHADSQFQTKISAGIELVPSILYFGAGVHFSLSGAGNSEATLSTVNPTGRLALDVGMNSTLYTGLFFRHERTRVTASFQQERSPEFVQKFDAKAPIGGETVFHQPLTVKSCLYFEPQIFDLEFAYDAGPGTASLGVAYEQWSRYRHPVLITEVVTTSGTIVSTTPPDSVVRDTWNPRVGFQIPLSETLKLAAGYTLQPMAVTDLSGVGNPLDNTTHVVALGLSQSLVETSGWPVAATWNLYLQQHFFESRTVTKKADSSTFTFGGSAYVYGGSLSIPL